MPYFSEVRSNPGKYSSSQKKCQNKQDLKHKDLLYNTRHDLSVNHDDTETLFLKIINQKLKNYFL